MRRLRTRQPGSIVRVKMRRYKSIAVILEVPMVMVTLLRMFGD